MIICYTDAKDNLSDVYSLCSEYEEIYIGDISLLLSDINYKMYWNDIYGCQTGLFDIDGYEFYVFATESNDGYFVDTDGVEYDINSGCIGIVPVELCSCDVVSVKKCRRLITKSVDIQTLSDKALYIVYNTGSFTIPTSFNDILTVDEFGDIQDNFDCSDLMYTDDEDFDCLDKNYIDDDDDFDCIDIINSDDDFDCINYY